MEEQSKTIAPVEHNNQRILTTAQLAEFYGTDEKYIQRNFQRNQSRYVEGKHFYRLEGESLRQFLDVCERQFDAHKNAGSEQNISKLRVLYLWTEKGAWLLAKSLNTDEAWQACEMLVDDYYRRGEDILALRSQLAYLAQENAHLHDSCSIYLNMLEKSITMPGLSEEGIKHIESLGVGEALTRLRKAFFHLEANEQQIKEHVPSIHKDIQKLRQAVLDICNRSVDADTELVMVSRNYLQQEQVINQLKRDVEQFQLAYENGPLALLAQQEEEN